MFADMFAGVFQAVNSSGNLGVERCMKRTKLMLIHRWKLDRNSENDNPVNLFFTMKELRDAINSDAATPGRDGLSYELFKHLDDFVREEILALFNSVWAEACLPMDWKHAVIVPRNRCKYIPMKSGI